MTSSSLTQTIVLLVLLRAIAKPLGSVLVKVFEGRTTFLSSLERLIYRVCRIDPKAQQT